MRQVPPEFLRAKQFLVEHPPSGHQDVRVILRTTPQSSEPIFSDATLQASLQYPPNLPLRFTLEWFRHRKGCPPVLVPASSDYSIYECSPLDIGCTVELRVRYQEPGQQAFKQLMPRLFGPVHPAEPISKIQSSSPEYFRLQLSEGISTWDLNAILNSQNLILIGSNNSEFYFRSGRFLDLVQLRADEKTSFALTINKLLHPQLAQDLGSFLSRLPAKQQSTSFPTPAAFNKSARPSSLRCSQIYEITFESVSRRNVFLMKLLLLGAASSIPLQPNFKKQQTYSALSNTVNVSEKPATAIQNLSNSAHTAEIRAPTTTNPAREHSDSQQSQGPNSPHKRNVSSHHHGSQQQQQQSTESRPLRRMPTMSLQSSQQLSASTANPQLSNSSQTKAQRSLDAQFGELLSDDSAATSESCGSPAALNLRDSFAQLEQRRLKMLASSSSNKFASSSNYQQQQQLHKPAQPLPSMPQSRQNSQTARSNSELILSAVSQPQASNAASLPSSISSTNLTLQAAIQQIQALQRQVLKLKAQNQRIPNQTDLQGQLKRAYLKIEQLTTQNKRLEAERTQIITDRINTQMKYKKSRNQIKILQDKYDALMLSSTVVNPSLTSTLRHDFSKKNTLSEQQQQQGAVKTDGQEEAGPPLWRDTENKRTVQTTKPTPLTSNVSRTVSPGRLKPYEAKPFN